MQIFTKVYLSQEENLKYPVRKAYFKLKKRKSYIEIIHFKTSTYIERFINSLRE